MSNRGEGSRAGQRVGDNVRMASEALEAARVSYDRRAWDDAYRQWSEADRQTLLGAQDLGRLATAAHLTGRVEAATEHWERAVRAHLDAADLPAAVRCAFWLGLTLVQRGESARGGGWLARAATLLDGTELDCVEHGYLRVAGAMQTLDRDPGAAVTAFDEIVAIADRFTDPDLQALGRLGRGQALIGAGDVARGVASLDEAMVAVTTGETSPVAAGLVYCAVILTCRRVFDLRRAQEWTAALSRWCDGQQGLQPYRGQCLVHRSEILQLRGDWDAAMDEAHGACLHLADPPGDPVLGMALYQQAELFRLRGEFVRAERAYRGASESGHPAQPGLALLRLAQGRVDDAMASMRRAVADTAGSVERARALAAFVEIALAAGDADAARTATAELGVIARRFDSPYLRAVVAAARGGVLLVADREPMAAAVVLREAGAAWRELEAPFEGAHTRLRLAQACAELGDHDGAGMELEAARAVFERLQAAPALERVRELEGTRVSRSSSGLTPRELEVLRRLATGATNKQIADALEISDKTVARHVANLFTKLGVGSRSGATAYAYEHQLV